MVTSLVIGDKTDGPGSSSPSSSDLACPEELNQQTKSPDTDLALLQDPSHVSSLLADRSAPVI